MLKRGFGTQTTAALTKFDVAPLEAIAKGTIRWLLEGLPETEHGRIVIPPYLPIVSVNSGTVSRNTEALNAAPSWELLKGKAELPSATDTDFMILMKYNPKAGVMLGYGLYFYNKIPEAGRERLRATWVYGYNVDSKILREYATLHVSKKVVIARLMSGEPVGLASYRGPDLQEYVNTQASATLSYIDDRLREIEKNHLPQPLPIASLQGI